MSDVIVPVVRVKCVRPHPNADRLDLVEVLGYQLAVQKGAWKSDDVGVYFPADTVLSQEMAEREGIRTYLGGKDKDRVRRVRLRGEPSFGLLLHVPEGGESWRVGDNVAEYFGANKYEPPKIPVCGNDARYNIDIDPHFHKYTKIQNGRLLYYAFRLNEPVVVTEKIHGTNSRVGVVHGEFVAGSRTRRKKRPEDYADDIYWLPWQIPGVRSLLSDEDLVGQGQNVVLYGELYGAQSLRYGMERGKYGYRAFDLSVNGEYLDWDRVVALCQKHGVETAPVLYRGPFSLPVVDSLSDGQTTITGAENIREGVVVKPLHERHDPKLGRVVLKFIGKQYELSKHKKKDTTDV